MNSNAQIQVIDKWEKFSDGLEYFTKSWVPTTAPIATVLFIHGMGDHISRYNHIFTQFAEKRIKVLGFDERGFSRTARRNGIPGHTGGMNQALKDISEADALIKTNKVPHFVMGHRYLIIRSLILF